MVFSDAFSSIRRDANCVVHTLANFVAVNCYLDKNCCKKNGSLSKKLLGPSSIKINPSYAGLIQVGKKKWVVSFLKQLGLWLFNIEQTNKIWTLVLFSCSKDPSYRNRAQNIPKPNSCGPERDVDKI